jgi:hypothetical protein
LPEPGFEAAASRWVRRAAAVGGLAVGALWWLSASGGFSPQPGAGVGQQTATNEAQQPLTDEEKKAAEEKKKKAGAGCAGLGCDGDAFDGCVVCVDVGDCAGADCSGCDCAGADCSGVDCAGADCSGCDCGGADCSGLDCGGCAVSGVRMRGVQVASAAGTGTGASKGCSRRGGMARSALLLAAPLFVLGAWHGLAARSARRKARESKAAGGARLSING